MDKPYITLTIGTAGHVDHGKTTLVKRLTGTNTDRLEEEHRRGISIVLGYAELSLPSGRRVSLVDVPGHERFVKNMVAGATGVDAFLLTVAADDGVMPQTREHLDVLRMLGVRQGVVALTKVDIADSETVALAEMEVQELLESTGITAPIIPVSAVTGEGIPELLSVMDELGREERGAHANLTRLPVDRAFVLKGIGLVVTGTLWSGEIKPGDVLYIQPAGLHCRVRGVQNHNRPAEAAYAGARTALDLSGVDAARVRRGDFLLSRPLPASATLDVRVRLLESSLPLLRGAQVRVYHGTRASVGRLRFLDNRDELHPGQSALARLSVKDPLVVVSGDHFVLRSMSPQVTIGGGTVLDPVPRGRRPQQGWLEALEARDLSSAIPLALDLAPGRGVTAEELSLNVPASPEKISAVASALPQVVTLGSLYARAGDVDTARSRLLQALHERAERHPERPSLSMAEARTVCVVEAPLADEVIASMPEELVQVNGDEIKLKGAGEEIPEELEREAEHLLESLRAAGTEPLPVAITPGAKLLLARGQVVQVSDKLLSTLESANAVLKEIQTICRAAEGVTLAGLRDRLHTSRKYAQAWLEYADSTGVTKRVGDHRVLTRRWR